MLLVSGNSCFQCAADHGLHGSFFKHPANICCQAPLVLLITHDNIMVKWGRLACPKTVRTEGEWWISSWILIFTITTYGSTQRSKHGVKHLSVTFMDPVQLHLMATRHMTKKNYWVQLVWLPLFVFFVLFSIATYKQDLQCHIFIMSSVCHWT